MNNELLKLNYYELFELPQNFTIDIAQLTNKMRQLQQEYHPDNFANDAELLARSLAISSHINHAYNTLLAPQSRAIYLLQLHDVGVDLVHDTKFTSEFLFKQIELREAIEEAEDQQDIDKLEELESITKQAANELVAQITNEFALSNYSIIIELIKQLAFYNKLTQVIDNIISNL